MNTGASSHRSTRLLMVGLLALVIPAGLFSRRLDIWPILANGLGAALYVVAGIALLQLIWPRARTDALALAALLGTCTIELAQLSAASWLVATRATTPGRLLLGSNGGFDSIDFLWYALGAALGYAACRALVAITQPRAGSHAPPLERDAPGS